MVATIPVAVPAVVATIPVPMPLPEAAAMVRGDCRSRRGRCGRGCLARHCGGSSSDAAEECPRCQYAGCGFGSPAHVHCTISLGGRTRSGRARRLRYPPDLKGKPGGSSPPAVGALFACSGWLLRAPAALGLPRLHIRDVPCIHSFRPVGRSHGGRPIRSGRSKPLCPLVPCRREAAGDLLPLGQGEFRPAHDSPDSTRASARASHSPRSPTRKFLTSLKPRLPIPPDCFGPAAIKPFSAIYTWIYALPKGELSRLGVDLRDRVPS